MVMMKIMNNINLTLDLDKINFQNEMIGKALNNRNLYAKERRLMLNNLVSQINHQLLTQPINDFHDHKPFKLDFVWHLKNYRHDADNISSAGRKIILDAMQKSTDIFGNKLICNDNLHWLNEFHDRFVVDGNNFVEISMISN